MIPKVVYQTFYTKNLPENVLKVIDNMKKNNPNYQFYLFDDLEIETFIKEEFGGDVYKAFNMMNVGSAKADLWRYCILYKKGGIYLDIDSENYGEIDNLVTSDDEAIVSRESHNGIFLQWCLMFSPNHPILRRCIQKCISNILNKTSNDILRLTGPVIFSESVFEYCKYIGVNPWSTSDDSVNIILKGNGLKLKIHSTDFKNFCKFKHDFYNELEMVNIQNNRPAHWSQENKIYK